MLDELLEEKQITLEEDCKIEGLKKIESAQKHIYMLINEANEKKEPIIKLDHAFESELASNILLLEELKEKVDNAKKEILEFLDKNHPKSFETDKLVVKYTSATTQTSIDSKLLKSKYPAIAAECSSTVPKKSSVSIKADRVKVE
jgi:hypothetical protein